MAECLPITVLSTVYRLFASAITRELLAQWSRHLPSGIYGALPGRASRDAALNMELRIEDALDASSSLQGLSLDLSKYFNTIPRAPAIFLLTHLGTPPDVASLWHQFLGDVERHPLINGHCGSSIPSTAGLPEGDPLSVASQAAVNWLLLSFVKQRGLEVLTFIDNWAFLAASCCVLLQALALVQHFYSALRLVISWPKSYFWAFLVRDRRTLQLQAPRFMPEGAAVSLCFHGP